MELGPLEAQLLISASLATPAIAVLTYAALKGHLTRMEDAKYVAVLDREPDYWDETELRYEPKRGEDDADQALS